jgi:predicted alpha/beta-hydrolase family hydrolase
MSAATSMAHVILNPGSGAGNKAVLTRAIETAFTAQGWQVEFVWVGRHNVHTRARRRRSAPTRRMRRPPRRPR